MAWWCGLVRASNGESAKGIGRYLRHQGRRCGEDSCEFDLEATAGGRQRCSSAVEQMVFYS